MLGFLLLNVLLHCPLLILSLVGKQESLPLLVGMGPRLIGFKPTKLQLTAKHPMTGFNLALPPIRKGAGEALVEFVFYTFEFAIRCEYHLKTDIERGL
ncbi:hypothetical protein H671_7g17283 [Cricetulus griseus]|uniref:Uncharacterized protein n=1 Tax=Cricetulus griseus TaxID=10029 RepID=A0A061I3Q7_CRIGR|nr:hypothetical protein H671_7g17283 [Cricetulus griseus]